MAGGKGERLKPVTNNFSKPMLSLWKAYARNLSINLFNMGLGVF